MTKDLKFSLLDLNSSTINIPIGEIQSFIPIGNDDLIQNQLLKEKESELINENIIDLEKINYVPNNSFSKIEIEVYNNSGTNLTYEDLGYTNDDIKFQRNRFKNSFLLFDFFDSFTPTNQKRLLQISVYNQITSKQLDGNGDLLDVSVMPLTFDITNPKKRIGGNYEGYNLFWYKNPPYVTLPKSIYAYISYYNAVDGSIVPLISYPNALELSDYLQYNWIRYILNSNGNNYTYTIDFYNRDLSINSGKLIFNLYQPSFL